MSEGIKRREENLFQNLKISRFVYRGFNIEPNITGGQS